MAANSLLRERVAELCEREGLELKLVAPELCTDNAAMIASAARFREPTRYPDVPRLGRRPCVDGGALRAARTATSATRRGRRFSASNGIELREVDIDSDERLLAAMLERIPVVEIDGEVVSELEFDARRVLALGFDTVSTVTEPDGSASVLPPRRPPPTARSATATGSRSASPRGSRATCRC